MVVKKEGTVKMMDDSTCEIIGTETINIIGRDEIIRALGVVRYVPEARYNLISI